MDRFHYRGDGSGDGDGYSSIVASSSACAARRRRLPSQFSASAFLGLAFNACAATSGTIDVDASLLRYTRSQLFSSSPSSSSSSDEMPLHIRQLLHRLPSLGSSLTSPLSPVGRSRSTPGRSTPVYCTPARGAVMEDGVLVINDGPQGDNRMGNAATRRLQELGSNSFSSYGASSNNIFRNSGGAGSFHRIERRRSFEGEAYAMEPLQAITSQITNGNRNRTLPSATPVVSSAVPVIAAVDYPMAAAIRDDGFELEVGGESRQSFVPNVPPAAEAGAAPDTRVPAEDPFVVSAMYAGVKGPARAPDPRKPTLPYVWMWTMEEEEKLCKVIHGPANEESPPMPSASTFVWPPTEEQEAEIERVMHGPRRWRRLPVFSLICPDL